MFQPRQHNLLTRLLDLAGQKHLVENGVDLVKVEDEIELAHVAEEGVEDLDEEVDGLEVGELVVVSIDAGAEEEPGVAAVDDLVVAVLDKVGLVLLVARSDETVDLGRWEIASEVGRAGTRATVGGGGSKAYLALELDLLVVAVWGVPLCEAGFPPGGGVHVSDGTGRAGTGPCG